VAIETPKTHDPRHFIERSQVLSRNRKSVKRREVSRPATRCHIKARRRRAQ